MSQPLPSLCSRHDVVVVGASLCAAGAAKRLVEGGLDTLVIEKKKLPRHKICSGIISPRGYRFYVDNFGEPPPEAFHEPKYVKGVNFLFRNGAQLPVDFDAGPTPHIYRKHADHWAIRQSGATVQDRVTFKELEPCGDGWRLHCTGPGGEPLAYEARNVIAADGPCSRVVQALYPGYKQEIHWFVVGQKYYRGHLDLDPDYFHFVISSDLGYYVWSHPENGCQIIGSTCRHGDNWARCHDKVVDYFRQNHGFQAGEETCKEGCIENFGLSVTNQFVFGRDGVLVSGQAAGFLNMMAEGMSCALHSGAIAGESIIEARARGLDVNAHYVERIQSEQRRTVDQWNPLKIAFSHPHEADAKKALFSRPLSETGYMAGELIKFCKQFHGLGWGVPIMKAAAKRLFTGRY